MNFSKLSDSEVENKSSRECIETLVAISPKFVPEEKRRELTPEKTELKVSLDKHVIEKLDRIKALLSHKSPGMTDGELINILADLGLEKLDPTLTPTRTKSLPAPVVKSETINERMPNPASSRYIPSELRRAVWIRDKSRCVYKNCHSTRFLEIDHIVPIAQGGRTELANLRLLCHAHNQRAAIERFGLKHMDKFINRPSSAGNNDLGVPT